MFGSLLDRFHASRQYNSGINHIIKTMIKVLNITGRIKTFAISVGTDVATLIAIVAVWINQKVNNGMHLSIPFCRGHFCGNRQFYKKLTVIIKLSGRLQRWWNISSNGNKGYEIYQHTKVGSWMSLVRRNWTMINIPPRGSLENVIYIRSNLLRHNSTKSNQATQIQKIYCKYTLVWKWNLKTDNIRGVQLNKVTNSFHPLVQFQVFAEPNIVT